MELNRRSGLRFWGDQWGFCVAAGLLSLGVMGCGARDGRPPIVPVKGFVQVSSKPASGAFVVFHPEAAKGEGEGEEAERPTALVNPDGSFELTTQVPADGARIGDYRVTVQWRKAIRQVDEFVPGPELIPANYGSPQTTPLRVSVKAGEPVTPRFEISGIRRR